VVFQPHRYTRTRDLFDDFAQVLSGVDALVLLEVYPAGEAPIPQADGRALARGIRTRGHVDPVFVEKLDDVVATLKEMVQDGDLVLTMGAGNVGALAATLVEKLGEQT
jgi:UDP-N-acetylmuramate--alanine ligase